MKQNRQSQGRCSKQPFSTKPAASLTGRLAAYSAAAGAVLAVSEAGAQISNITSFTYNSTTTTVPPNFPIVDGLTALTFTAGAFHGGFTEARANTGTILALGLFHGNVMASAGGQVLKLTPGHAIANAPGSTFNTGGVLAANNTVGVHSGNFLPAANGAATGYVGIKTQQNGHTYYGWLNVKITADSRDLPSDLALVAVAGHPGIYGALGPAGTTAGELAETPEPGTLALGGLGLLALGARGVRELRRRRETAAKN